MITRIAEITSGSGFVFGEHGLPGKAFPCSPLFFRDIIVGVSRFGNVLVSKVDEELFLRYNWSVVKSGEKFYARRKKRISGISKTFLLHREIMKAKNGQDVDHINGDGMDNRRENLRLCSRRENIQNSVKRKNDASSIYKGVHLCKNRWRSKITINGKQIHIGYFDHELDAAKAYDGAAIRFFGDFARPNFPNKSFSLAFNPSVVAMHDRTPFSPEASESAKAFRLGDNFLWRFI